MKEKGLYIVLGTIAAIVLACCIYVFAGKQHAQTLMRAYLADKGYAAHEIQSIEVRHSFLNVLLSYNEWSIHVRYADEPGALYIFTVRDGAIRDAGVSGTVDKENLKHIE